MEPQERTVSPLHEWRRTTTSRPEEDHSRSRRSNGWAECREKNIGIGTMESTFLLTSLLIGPLRTTGCLKKPKPIAQRAASPGDFEICPQTVSLGCAHRGISFIRLRHSRKPVKSSIRFEDKTSAMGCMEFSGRTSGETVLRDNSAPEDGLVPSIRAADHDVD